MGLWFIFFLNFLTFHGFPFIAYILFFVDVDEDIDHFNFEQQELSFCEATKTDVKYIFKSSKQN